MQKPLPSGAELVRTILFYTGGYAVLASAVITLYLSGLIQLTGQQWWLFLQVVGGAFLLIFPGMLLAHWNIFQCIRLCLDHRAAGVASREELCRGFAAISDFPRYWFTWGLLWWGLGSVLVSGGMWLSDSSFGLLPGVIVVCATLSVAFIMDMYYYFSIKRVLAPVRLALAADLGDSEERQRLVHPVSLRTKLLASMTSVILVTVVYAGFLAHIQSREAVQAYALKLQSSVLDALAEEEDLDYDSALRRISPFGGSLQLVVLDPAAERVVAGPALPLLPGMLQRIRELDRAAGNSAGFDSEVGFSWRQLGANGRVWLALTAADGLGDSADVGGLFSALLLFSTVVTVGVAILLAHDVSEATRILRSGAARIADGDLTRGEIFESEDELGELGRSFERMASSLRSTVERVIGAADRMQSAAEEIASATSDVAEATEAQLSRVVEVGTSMESIDVQVRDISLSATSLDSEVDQASNSLVELENNGGELSSSAAALSSTVDEVAVSIEEMASSISQVKASSEGLADVADDTSVNMDQAAVGMQAVSTTAEAVSRLSMMVVELAEKGQGRVHQTIEGMEAIYQATDSAGRVIAGLAESAAEIDGAVGVIDDVANETNLLALNASIIAAQAGEHGRGFAVVAGQVRSLADRVTVSTKTIIDLIRAVSQESSEASGAVARGAESVERGMGLSGDAGVSLEEITRAARESGERIAEIVSTVEEQSRAVSHVAELMGKLRSGTGQISTALSEQANSTSVLRQNSTTMGEVSRQLENASAEQALGTTGIRRNMQTVHDSVGQINAALQQQADACRQVADFLEQLRGSTASNEQSVRRLDGATSGLKTKAEELHAEVAHFRI